MSLVKPELWKFWMGDMPMPEDCTHEQMRVMYDAINEIERRESTVEQIAFWEGMWRKEITRYKEAEKHKDESPEAAQRYENCKAIMKIIKDSILTHRKELAN